MKQTSLLSLLLALLLVCTLAGCGRSGGDGEPGSDTGSETASETASETDSSTTEPDTPPLSPAEEQAASILSGMTTEEKVGQLFFVRCPESGGAADAASFHLGGLLLFGRDFKGKTREQVTGDIAGYQAAANIPLFIGVDEEGGTVVRVSSNEALRASKFQSPQTLYAAGGMSAILADCGEKDALLASLGIQVNFAPVADVSTDPNDFMYARAFGQDAQATADYVSAVVARMNSDGMGSVLKHFPGYGNNVDTHTGIATDNRSLESFRSVDFLPFRSGIAAGAPFVLVSHNIMTCVDASLPASLSAPVHDLLRDELGFSGVILTDDLAMDAVKAYAENGSVAVLAVQAGNDMIVTTDYAQQIPLVLAAVQSGAISQSELDAHVTRILLAKIALGLIG